MSAFPDKTGYKNDIQSVASANTYLERYTLLKVTGFATNENETDGRTPDDGKKKPDIPKKQPAAEQKKPETEKAKQEILMRKKIIGDLITNSYNGNALAKFQKITGLKKLADIPNDIEEARKVCAKIQKFIRKDPDAKKPAGKLQSPKATQPTTQKPAAQSRHESYA
jgi:hypothetical protein